MFNYKSEIRHEIYEIQYHLGSQHCRCSRRLILGIHLIESISLSFLVLSLSPP